MAGHLLSNGKHVWTTKQASAKPLASDADRVFATAAAELVALDSRTGSVQWQVGLGGPPTATPLAQSGWVIAAAAGDLLAIRATDGHVIWRRTVGPIEFRPAIDGDLLVVSIVDGDVLGLDLETGNERWHCDLGASPADPFVIGGRVYVGSSDKKFFSLKASSGEIDWRRFVGALVMGRAAADDRHVYFAALDNAVRAVDRGHGALKWRKGLPYRPAAGPVVLGGHVLVPGPVESMPSFKARTGEPGGSIKFPASLAALPLLSQPEAGAAFVAAMTGGLENKWMLSLFDPSPLPELPVLPLTELPGEAVPLPGR